MTQPRHQIQKIMDECRVFRSHGCASSIELQIYFEFMHQTILGRNNFFINCTHKQTNTQIFPKQFYKAFEDLSQIQAALYYHFMLNTVHEYANCSKSIISSTNSILKNHEPQANYFAVDIIKKGFFNNTEKVHYLQIDKKKSILLIKSERNPYDLQINLKSYIVRQSGRNKKHKAKKQFLILKTGNDSTPEEMRFSMKDFHDFPIFFNDLWTFMLQVHSQKIKSIIDQVSVESSKKNYVEIVLTETRRFIQNPESESGVKSSESRSLEDYQYLDIKHPCQRVSEKVLARMCTKEQESQGHCLWGNEWENMSNGRLKNTNYKYITVQRNAAKKVIKSFISMANGESQLPIQMFCNHSNLLLLAKASTYFSYFFQPTKMNHRSIEEIIFDEFKKTLCSIVGFLLIGNQMEKPIQPFIGSTYQGFIDGYPISLQQIGKNQSYILFETHKIKLYGCLQLISAISGINSIKAGSKGYLTVETKSPKRTSKIIFTLPMIELSGLIYGDRLVQINDTSVIYEKQSGIFCLLNWGRNNKANQKYRSLSERYDFFQGDVVKLKGNKTFDIQKYIQNQDYFKQFSKNHVSEKVLGELYGNWTKQVFSYASDDEQARIFNVQNQKPNDLYHYSLPLLSDCRLRRDIRLLGSGQVIQAEKERKMHEEQQLHSEKLRILYRKS